MGGGEGKEGGLGDGDGGGVWGGGVGAGDGVGGWGGGEGVEGGGERGEEVDGFGGGVQGCAGWLGLVLSWRVGKRDWGKERGMEGREEVPF